MNESLPISPQHMPVERPPMLTEHLPHHPYELLHAVFSSSSSCDTLKTFLLYWLQKFDNERDISDWKDDRRAPLNEFYYSLLNLVDALRTNLHPPRAVVLCARRVRMRN